MSCCVSAHAFPVVGAKCGRAVQPVAAASFYGKGRVLAVGHPSFYTEEGTSKADTAAFINNGVAWLGQGKATVAVYRNQPVAKALDAIGALDVTEIPSLESLADFPVLAVYPDSLKPDEVERIRQFIVSGGGLLASGIGWGWRQVSQGKSLATENLFNRLLGPAGLLISSEIADRTATDGYLAAFPLPAGVNAVRPPAWPRRSVFDPVLLRQINQTLCAPNPSCRRIRPAAPLDALMDSPAAAAAFSRAALKAGDIPRSSSGSPGRMKRQAATWPARGRRHIGLPPAGAATAARSDLGIPRWHGTGLHAVAGEPVCNRTPPGSWASLRIGERRQHAPRPVARGSKVDLEIP